MLSTIPHVFRTNMGEYLTSFFLIRLDSSLRDGRCINEQQFTKEEYATFVHEYLHFLQDVTTASGLARFVSISKIIQTGIFEIYHSDGLATVPYNIDNTSVKNAAQEFELQGFYQGSDEYKRIHHINNVRLEHEELLDELFPDSEGIENVALYFDGNDQPYYFGSDCIRESISYLIEHIRFGAEIRDHELPYNSCEMVCEYLYPELAGRKDVLVLLAECSLMHYHSGKEFYELIKAMKQHRMAESPTDDIARWCMKTTLFLEENFNSVSQEIGEAVDFLYPPNTPFSHANAYLKCLLKGGIIYHEEFKYPLFKFLHVDDHEKYLNTMLHRIGIPLIASNQDETFSVDQDLSLFLVPIAVYQLLYTLKSPQCYAYPYCKAAQHPSFDETNCCYSPWKQTQKKKLCPFAAFWYHYSLSGKDIKIKHFSNLYPIS